MNDSLSAVWHFHNQLNLFMLHHLPEGGLGAVTLLKNGQPSTGRNVAKVFAHIHAVRLSRTPRDLLAGVPSFEKGAEPGKEALEAALAASGAALEAHLARMQEPGEGPKGHDPNRKDANGGGSKGYDPVSLLGYLISHESHHRGQIMLALKQSGMRPSESLRWGLWQHWRSLDLPALESKGPGIQGRVNPKESDVGYG